MAKLLINIAVACSSALATTLLYNYFHQKRNEIIFFYGKQPHCDYHRNLTTVQNIHETNKCSMCKVYKIIGWLNEAQTTIDVCMYMLTYDLLANAIINAHKRGVQIRLILDQDNVEITWKMGIMGIAKKVKRNSSCLMHHKFIIIDNKNIISGSMNWTYTGAHRNWENVFISNNHKLVDAFSREFQRLWKQFTI